MSNSKVSCMSRVLMAVVLAGAAATASAQTTAVTREGQVTVEVRQPTPAEVKALAETMAATTSEEDKDLTVVQHKNGMQSVDLKGRFQSLAVAKKNSDGTVSVRCVETPEEKAAFLASNKTSKRRSTLKRAEKE